MADDGEMRGVKFSGGAAVGLGGDAVVSLVGGAERVGGGARPGPARRTGGAVRIAVSILVLVGWATVQLVPAVPAAAAGAPVAGQWNEVAVPRVDGRLPDLTSISCATSGWCVAAGSLPGDPPAPVVVIDDGGRLEPVTTGLLPAGATGGRLTSVSCAPRGNCVVAGWASAPGGGTSVFTAVVSSDAVGTPELVPGMAVSMSDSAGPAVSCPSPTWCVVIGRTPDGSVARSGVPGSWHPMAAPPGLASAGSVDCVGPDRCDVGVGALPYGVGAESLSFAQLVGPGWSTTRELVSVPRNTFWTLTGMACRTVSQCVAAVTGTGAFPGGAVAQVSFLSVDPSAHGGPSGHRPPGGAAGDLPFPSSSASGPFGPFALSCPTGGACEAVGSVHDAASTSGLAAELTSSGWTQVPVVGPGTGSGPPEGLDALWCNAEGGKGSPGGAGGAGGGGPHGTSGQGATAADCVATGDGVVADVAAVSGTELPTGAAGGLLLAVAIGGTGLIALAVRTRRPRAARPVASRA